MLKKKPNLKFQIKIYINLGIHLLNNLAAFRTLLDNEENTGISDRNLYTAVYYIFFKNKPNIFLNIDVYSR